MSNICDCDRILKTDATCNISPETAELREMRQTRICGEQDF